MIVLSLIEYFEPVDIIVVLSKSLARKPCFMNFLTNSCISVWTRCRVTQESNLSQVEE